MTTSAEIGQAQSRPKTLKMGILGLGVSGGRIARAMAAMPEIELIAAADVRPKALADFKERYGGNTYETPEGICNDPNVEALWISTPNQFHAEHLILAAQHSKHAVIEKPIAINMRQAQQMMEAAERNGVTVVCGHTQSYTPRARATRRIIKSGELGKLGAMHVWAYTDWMLRPRSAVDMDYAQGGGVPYRQAPHQVDTLRLLGGGRVHSVRGMIGQWFAQRTIPGYYSAFIEFENGTPATLMHNGYGYFMTNELVPWESPGRHRSIEERNAVRQALRTGAWDEAEAKEERYLGGRREAEESERRSEGPRVWVPDDLGMLVVSCERGDIRYSPHGLFVYSDDGVRDVPVEERPMVGVPEITELYEAAVLGKPLMHSLPWGAATLEVCLAIMQSAKEHREIILNHQVSAPDFYE